jgi:hypothetical protein
MLLSVLRISFSCVTSVYHGLKFFKRYFSILVCIISLQKLIPFVLVLLGEAIAKKRLKFLNSNEAAIILVNQTEGLLQTSILFI